MGHASRTLTTVSATDQTAKRKMDSCGHLSGLDADAIVLSEHPAALAERRGTLGMDHVFFARYMGTNYFQWQGRRSDGRHYPVGCPLEMHA